MTAEEIKICRAFKNVTFPLGTGAKRLAQEMAQKLKGEAAR